jgi:hypothetical protein
VDVADGQRDYTAGRPSRRAWLRDQQVKLGAGVAALVMVTAGIALAQGGGDPPATVVAEQTTTTTDPASSLVAPTTTGRPPFRWPTTTSPADAPVPSAAPTTASTGPPVGPSIGPPIGPPAVAAPAPTPAPTAAPAPPAAPTPPSRPPKPPRPAPEPVDRDLAKVKVSMDKRHRNLDTWPRFCDTPRIRVRNPTSRWVTSLRVRFRTVVTRYGKRSMGLVRGPLVRSGARAVRVPPWHTRSLPLRVCAGPRVLPKKPRNPPGAYLPEPRLLAKRVVRYRVTLD